MVKVVSHTPDITEATVVSNATSGRGLFVEQCYSVENEKDEVVARGTVDLNKLVTYEPSGRILIKAGQTLPITLTVAIPSECPTLRLPISDVGVYSTTLEEIAPFR